MKISERQLHLLLITFKESCQQNVLGIHSMVFEDRVELYEKIINQQSDELIEIESLPKSKETK